MKRVLVAVLALAAGLVAAAPATGASSRPGQVGPEYGVIVSAIAGALTGTRPVSTCPGPDLTVVTEALGGPKAVQELGLELVAQALGSQKKPWPRNHRVFTYQGRQWVPDFVKERSMYLVDTGHRIDLTQEVRDLQVVARKRGWQLVVVTRRKAAVTRALSKAASRSSPQRAGRIRVLRCI